MITIPDRPPDTLRCDPADISPYADLDKRNPEFQSNSYKTGLAGVIIGLLPIIIWMLWRWLS